MESNWRYAAVLAMSLGLAGCNETEDHSSVCHGPALGLDGTWFGAMEDDDGTLFTLEWQICSDRILSEYVSGFGSGVTGRFWQEGRNSWHGVLSDGTTFRFFTGASRRHATLVTEYFEFAVLERDAPWLPRYRFGDLDGHWHGRHAYFDWSQVWVDEAWALCGAGDCASYEAGGVSATLRFDAVDPDFGLFRGRFSDSLGQRGLAGAMLSPDLQFLGTYTCPSDYRGPEDCTFGALLFD